jgi:hypothetical protein
MDPMPFTSEPLIYPFFIQTQSANVSASILDENYTEDMLDECSLEKLVDHLVPSMLFGDTLFVPTFLGSYHRFTTTQHVLEMLFSW